MSAPIATSTINRPRAAPDEQSTRTFVVVPVYNHPERLNEVLSGLAALDYHVIVVNDGSTDATNDLLAVWNNADAGARVEVVTHPCNRGKAAALRTGFDRAALAGATHIATIDADGQLDPTDVPRLVREAEEHPRALIIGCRPKHMNDCPARCVVGRRNASLGVLAQTGLRLNDTQCGLRVYPVELVRAVRCRAGRYAFEAEVITRAAWAGFDIREVPVGCRYFSADERKSHWKPWRDSVQQGLVHFHLIAVALLPWSGRKCRRPRPDLRTDRVRGFLRWLNPMRSWRQIRHEPIGDLELASGVAIGAWIGALPFFGLHTLISVYVAWRLHQHPAAVVLGSQVSVPPFGFALAAASIAVGHLLLTGHHFPVGWSSLVHAAPWRAPMHLLLEWLVGSVFVGGAAAGAAYFVALRIARRARRSAQPGGIA